MAYFEISETKQIQSLELRRRIKCASHTNGFGCFSLKRHDNRNMSSEHHSNETLMTTSSLRFSCLCFYVLRIFFVSGG